jgi:anti-sigma factor RsiW
MKKSARCEYLAGSKLRQYQERSIPPEERLTINEHLAVCDDCYRCYSEMYRLPDRRDHVEIDLTADESSAHLDFAEELAPYVDGLIDGTDREVIEIHLRECAICAREVSDLRAFAERLKDKS